MNSRQRIKTAINHKQPDVLPVDFGGVSSTGIHVSTLYKLRQRLGLDNSSTPVKVIEPSQMLGEIDEDLRKIMGVDCLPIWDSVNIFGFHNKDWKEWKLWDGTPILVPGLFNTIENKDGSIYQYPKGDKNWSPSGKMPKGCFFIDAIIRQKNLEESNLDPKDNLEEFSVISKMDLIYLREKVSSLYKDTDYAIVGMLANSSFGDIALVPGLNLKDPKGIRDVEEWYISIYRRRDYIKKVFEGQCEIALENYRRIFREIGNKINVVQVTGNDFGTQKGLFFSLETYRDVFKPFHKRINDWVHENTKWKTFIHTCGAVYDLIPDIIEAGFDILNPIQISAKGMSPAGLKKKYGKYITFWGGGIDTQKTFPLGTPKQVKEEIRRNIELLNSGGGFVFSTVHNIQKDVPIDNIIAMIEVIKEYRK